LCSVHPDRGCKISYDILGLHLGCNMGLVRETKREKIERNTIRIQSE